MFLKKLKFFPNKLTLLFAFFTVVLFSFCKNENVKLKNGFWRATISRADGHQIVFNFETKDSAGKKIMYVINGSEHLLVDSIESRGDSVFIQMPFFESSFNAKIMDEGNLQGSWVKKYGERIQVLPFTATFNQKKRFKVTAPPQANITGRWMTEFVGRGNKISKIVAEFTQQGSYLTGTFLDPTGDFRFLQGVVTGNSLKLSAFDGAHSFLFTAKIDDADHISEGKYYSGATSVEDWTAIKDLNAKVSDGFSETTINKDAGKLNFSFPNSDDSSMVSINDKEFKNKVVIIQILGSWCPNCMDETKFLSNFYNKNHQRGVEMIGLAYERTPDFHSSQKALQPFKKRLNVDYPVLITGVTVSDPEKAEKTLPQLRSINAFPTTIFVDKKGEIRKIESGFSGPATGEHYSEYKKKFNKIVEELLAE